jgi:hypothetical protein
MAEQIISPGVFTRENDQSFLPQGVGAIGAAIVGPTVKGPAFVPTVVKNFAEYERKFGTLSSDTFVPQTVREYLKSAGSVTVCRVLAGGGYTFTNGTNEFITLIATGSTAADKVLLGVIFPSKDTALTDLKDSLLSGNDINGNFSLTLSGANSTTTQLSASINPANSNYIFKQLGDSPDNSKSGVVTYAGTPGYTYINFQNLQTTILGQGNADDTSYGTQGSGSHIEINAQSVNTIFNGNLGQTEGYSYASTPFITSQFLDANKTTKELFKFHSLGHGTACNTDYKISIANLKEPSNIDNEEQYSTFSVIIRKYNDKDKSPSIVEQFNGCTLDPDSPNYISRVIGDRYPQYNEILDKVELLGNFSNISDYVRVEVTDAVGSKATSPKLSPKGFGAVSNPISTASLAINCQFPSASYEGTQTVNSNYSTKTYLGWKFDDKALDNSNFIKPLPSSTEGNVSGKFNVENYFGHASSSLFTGSLSASIDTTGATGPTANQLKFTVPFQGGEDGVAPYTVKFKGNESTLADTYEDGTNLYGFNLTNGQAGHTGYKKALDILSNQDEYDINMLALPGVIKQIHSSVTNAATDMVETRGDAFYIMDLAKYNQSVNQAVNVADGLDTNYAAVYYPWVKVLDTAANIPVLVPPSVIVPGAIAASDRIGAEWFAPAGLNRGVLGNVLEAKIRLNQSERDRLYNAKINPIATFPQTGVAIWGQKTLQERSTALDRINVRRLLIAVKKYIASSSRYLVFEQNTQATRNRFLNIVNPYLESVQQRQGLYAFRVQMDEANNTPDVIDRNQLVGAIFLQPTKTAEFIVLDFNVLPTGATFDA